MRLIFLDFDGVLHPLQPEVSQLERFCWLPTLEALVSGFSDVYIVVHSTWRYEYTEPEIRQLLGSLGHRFVGCAPRAPRQQAIEMVLQANRGLRGHLVLDDDPREFSGSALNVLLLDPQRGLSDEAAQRAIRDWLRSTLTDGNACP